MPATILENFDNSSDLLKKDIHQTTFIEIKSENFNLNNCLSDSGLKNEKLSNVLDSPYLINENSKESSVLLTKNKLTFNEDSSVKLRKENCSEDSGFPKNEEIVRENPTNHSSSFIEKDLSPGLDTPIKMKKKRVKNYFEEEESRIINGNSEVKGSSTIDLSCAEIKDSEFSEDIDSPIKLKKKILRNGLEDEDSCDVSMDKIELDSTVVVPSSNNEPSLNMDSPSKLKKKKDLNCLEDDDIGSYKIESDLTIHLPSPNNELEIDSPIKIKKKKFKSILEEDDSNSASGDCTSLDIIKKNEQNQDSTLDTRETSKSICQEDKIKMNHFDDLYDDELNMEENEKSKDIKLNQNSELQTDETSKNIFDEEKSIMDNNDDLYDNEVNMEDDDLNSDNNLESSNNRRAERFLNREVKGKDLIRQSLSLPYFQLPKPDFQKYIKETDECLEKPLVNKKNNSENPKQPKKITLKPTNTIVFEIGSSSMNKVKRFQKKVLDMMNCAGSSEDASKVSGGKKSSAPLPIGAERLSWKMKLLNDIAKKKEAVLKERNEMLEEVMENDEEEYVVESDNEIIEDDDKVDIHFPVIDPMNSRSENDTMEQNFRDISKGISHDDSHTMFGSTNKDWENDKEIESSPFCFSLPSFQPEGGFSKTANISSSSDFVSEANLSLIKEDELGKEVLESSRIDNLSLIDVHPLGTMSGDDEKIYGEVLAEEKLLIKERSIHGEMTADILDMCSGQFLDIVETPKTPPLMNLSADEESDVDVSEDIFSKDSLLEEVSDSDSDDELTFKRKVVKKRIRPISPIDEESRHGEEDTQVHPASVSVEMNSNFNFGKKYPDVNDALAQDGSNENINHEDSLMDDEEDISKNESKKRLARDYFEDEAELSGEEGSSDEDEAELDGEDPLIFDEEELPANDEIRDQIGTLHLKHLLDDDDQMIREVKNHFLDEGDLYSDAARQRKFNWSFNPAEPGVNPDLSGSDNEEEVNDSPFQQDKLKWKQENADNEIGDEVIETQTLEASLRVEVQRKISTHIVAQRGVKNLNKRPRNSFLDEEEAKKSLKKIKLDMVTGQGTRATKNFVFVESGGPTKRKISSHKNSIDTSVFDVI